MGSKFICVRFILKKDIIQTCLCDYYYNLCGGFTEEEKREKDIKYKNELDKLKKRDAIKIVKNQLFHYGIQGSYQEGFFESATDVIDQRELWWSNIIEWTNKVYPNLK
jgi:hypothetical protein